MREIDSMTMCAIHPDMPATAYCRQCGKPLCDDCRFEISNVIYCAEHAAATPPPPPRDFAFAPPPPPPPPAASPYTRPLYNGSPALALILGTIPGVGAIYNGQYAKGLVHAVIFGLLISIISSTEHSPLAPLFGILIGVWWFYMVLEAFHTARKRREGAPVDEFSGFITMPARSAERSGISAFILIGLGLLFLLNTTGLISMSQIGRYWPILLILAGARMLYGRVTRRHTQNVSPEFLNERR